MRLYVHSTVNSQKIPGKALHGGGCCEVNTAAGEVVVRRVATRKEEQRWCNDCENCCVVCCGGVIVTNALLQSVAARWRYGGLLLKEMGNGLVWVYIASFCEWSN